MKILLLEDNKNLAEIIKEMLEEKNFEVQWFQDGEEALYNIADGYDCFILDIHVPNISGMELLKEIRDRDRDTPAVIISSNIEADTIKKAYLQGCNDFLKKPFYILELEYKVNLLCKVDSKLLLGDGFYYSVEEESVFDKNNRPIKLTPKEHRFISLVAKFPNKPVSLNLIEEYVWEGEEVSIAGIRSLIKRIRTKLPKECLQTENFGYKMVVK